MLTLDQKINKNVSILEDIVTIVKNVTDKLVTSEVDGVLMRPSTPAELESFNKDLNDILLNKLRNRLGA